MIEMYKKYFDAKICVKMHSNRREECILKELKENNVKLIKLCSMEGEARAAGVLLYEQSDGRGEGVCRKQTGEAA